MKRTTVPNHHFQENFTWFIKKQSHIQKIKLKLNPINNPNNEKTQETCHDMAKVRKLWTQHQVNLQASL